MPTNPQSGEKTDMSAITVTAAGKSRQFAQRPFDREDRPVGQTPAQTAARPGRQAQSSAIAADALVVLAYRARTAQGER